MEKRLWIAVAAAAVLLRSLGLFYGLPAVFNADEPHHVNVAVSFGAGTLNPGVFKYPTLWMYALAGAYGAWFLAWSGLGLLRSSADFGALFVWRPELFYGLARALSAALSLAATARLARPGGLFGPRAGLWAAALLAVSPAAVVSAHAAKPDSLTLFLAACAWCAAARALEKADRRPLFVCAAFAGLAASAQYVAAPLALLVPATAWARRERPARAALACALVPAAFLLGSPFALLDRAAFLRDLKDLWEATRTGAPAGWEAARNAFSFAGHWTVGGALLAAGAVLAGRRLGRRAVPFLLPPAACALWLASSPEGAWARHQLAMFPALALLAALAVEELFKLAPRTPSPAARALLLAALLLPGAAEAWAFDRRLLLPDTRTLAARWIEANVPEGTSVLLDQEHASPPLRTSRAQAEDLLERARRAGHARARYFELMARSHPGGGYRIVRMERDPGDLRTGALHAARSAAGRETFDPEGGLAAARGRGIAVAVYTSEGVDLARAPELGRFWGQVEAKAKPLAAFAPEPGRVGGPTIRIWGLR